jgi:hypothetical protein
MNTEWRRRALSDRVVAAVRDDRGVAETIQLMFVAIPAVLFVLLLTLAGRSAEAHNRVEHSAESAAQAAALQRTPDAAARAATVTATATLGNCAEPAGVTVDTSNWQPGGIVSVEIRCRIDTADLAPLLPGSFTVTANSAAVIDHRRATP